MKKFIGEMSFDEFIEALKIIFLQNDKETETETEEKRNFNENMSALWAETVDTVRYFFSLEPVKFIVDCFNFVKYIFSKQCYIDLKNKIEDFFKQPLTQELFITRGKIFKAALYEIIETIVFVVVMVILIRFFVGEIRWIPSGSMHPTLLEGDRIVVERFSRFYKTPERGDIMVFYPPSVQLQNTPLKLFARLTGFFCKDTAYIKRVIGLPGEKFEIKSDSAGKYTVYINDEPLNEPYIMSEYDYPVCVPGMVCGPAVIPEGNYLMLGDNRGNSQDSRFWGFLPQDRFIGRAVFLFWPFNRVKVFKHWEY